MPTFDCTLTRQVCQLDKVIASHPLLRASKTVSKLRFGVYQICTLVVEVVMSASSVVKKAHHRFLFTLTDLEVR